MTPLDLTAIGVAIIATGLLIGWALTHALMRHWDRTFARRYARPPGGER